MFGLKMLDKERPFAVRCAVRAFTLLALLVLVPLGVLAAPGWAAEHTINTLADLTAICEKVISESEVLEAYQLSPDVSGDVLNFTDSISLDGKLRIKCSVTIRGNGHTLSRSLDKFCENGSVIDVGVSDDKPIVFIDGLTITGGNNNSSGGGIYICHYNFQGGLDAANVTLTNCTFTGNKCQSGGGGMFVGEKATATVTNCTFTDNESKQNDDCNKGNGGGMYINMSADVTVTNCTFAGNTADDYGAEVYCEGGTLNAVNTVFWNDKKNDGKHIALAGNDNEAPTLNLYNCAYDADEIVELTFDGISDWIPRNEGEALLWLKNKTDCVEAPNWANLNAVEVEGVDGVKHTVFPLTAADMNLRDHGRASVEINGVTITAPKTDQLGTPRDGTPDIGAIEYVAISISPDVLPPATLGKDYKASLEVTPASADVTVTTPAWLTYNSVNRTLTGVPTEVGSFEVAIAARYGAYSAEQKLSLTVDAANGGNDNGDNGNDNGNGGNNNGTDNNGGDNGNNGTEEKPASEKAAESLTPRLDPSSETVSDLITTLFGDSVEIVVLSTDVVTVSVDRTVADLVKTLNPEQLTDISGDHSVILAVLPEITPTKTAVFVLGVSFDITPEGTLKWHGFPKNAKNGVALVADEEECLFLDDDGKETKTAPENGHVNAVVKLMENVTYAPVITAETSTAPTGPTSDKDGGGCASLSGGLAMLALVGLVAARKH